MSGTRHSDAPGRVVRAPARVNLIGEHTDYNEGLVLPTTTALHTVITVTPRRDGLIRAHAAQFGEEVSFAPDELEPDMPLHWSSYVKGVAWSLRAAGRDPAGADLRIDGDIPLGKGLSSSASLEVAVALALGVGDCAPLDIAIMARRAEVEFVGLNCGIMDPLAIAACPENQAICIDCASLNWRAAPLPDQAALLLLDSGVRHELPTGGYNDRASECREAAQRLGRRSLRAADRGDVDGLPDVLARRTRHVLTENQRVADAFDALHAGRAIELGALINASHASLRDDYEVTCEEVDALQRIAAHTPGVLGARMVGAGFGGCVLVLAERSRLQAVIESICAEYGHLLGSEPWWHVTAPTAPAGEAR